MSIMEMESPECKHLGACPRRIGRGLRKIEAERRPPGTAGHAIDANRMPQTATHAAPMKTGRHYRAARCDAGAGHRFRCGGIAIAAHPWRHRHASRHRLP
ncbi:hypothetical protein, partial [Ralstonia pseudosolanacearum]|uniref:hypothetical protein n=1 Tax=Ralstonia pseudosolanacearum TaxID=1310165 RepID=UPI003CF4BC83